MAKGSERRKERKGMKGGGKCVAVKGRILRRDVSRKRFKGSGLMTTREEGE